MHVLIGGPARVGKSTLSKRVARLTGFELIHGDNLREALKTAATGEVLDTLNGAQDVTSQSPEEWIETLRRRDLQLWKGVETYLKESEGEPIIYEGGMYPDFLKTLGIPHIGVFLVASKDSLTRLRGIADNDPESWMAKKGFSDEWISRWASHNSLRSQATSDLAKKYGYPCFDVSEGFETAHETALAHIIQSI